MARQTQRSTADEDVAFAGAARQAEMVRAGEVSPTELVRMSLARIERLDPELNAFRKVFAEKALLEAEQAEARLKAGEERPLLGVPIAIKDEVDVAGEVNMHGTDGFTEPAKEDCEMVRRLREAGAIVVGLTLLPELAICGFTESATYGVTRNPWNLQRTPGGSSGGSAAAVAAGLVPIASAGDGGGSIRIPASSCGLFGLKPSRGRISLAPQARRLERARGRSAASAAPCSTRRSGSTSSPAARSEAEAPPPPERPFVESAKTAPGKLRVAWSTAGAAAACAADRLRRASSEPSPDAAELLASLGHEVAQRDPDWGGIGNNITAALPARRRGDGRRGPAPRAPRTAHPRLRQARPAAPRRRSSSGRCAAAPPTPPASTRSSTPATSWSRR